MTSVCAPSKDRELLAILRCPESRQPLRLADPILLARLQHSAKTGGLKNIRGEIVSDSFEAVLVRDDAHRGYLVRDGIPLMLIDESIPL
ncbi:MAG: hypothetical protein NTZ01_04245 [Verrucomicrobia bacterium]|nr:hypothetical protein [Verrucomicrobiota bacterium]